VSLQPQELEQREEKPGLHEIQDRSKRLQTLFSDDEENLFTDKEANVILKAISEVKILDPACGSGAFPMGALHKIVKLLQKLDKGAIWWKKKQLEKARNLDSKYFNQFKEKLENANSDYARKLGVIQHSIYGVDIQPIAAEISKLRSFLSLIIDENIDDNAENRGIEPLPNLEFKFVTANTLIGLDEGVSKNTGSVSTGTLDFGETEDLQYDLQVLRNAYLQANPNEKLKLRKDFENLQTKIYKQETKDGRMPSKRAMQLSSWKPFSHDSTFWFDPEWMFGIPKFDIVIGNPPYLGQKSNNAAFQVLKNTRIWKYHQRRMDYFYFFFHLGLDILNENGVLAFITTNYYTTATSADKLRQHIKSSINICTLVNFNEFKIFPSALGQHNLITILNKGYSDSCNIIDVNRSGNADSNLLKNILSNNDDKLVVHY
jgi:hypothetical protein